MLGLGAWELAMVMVVALVVLGPDKIPEVARKLARFLGQARRMADDVRRNVDEAIQDAEPKVSPPAGAFTEWLERQQARDHAAPDGTFEAAPVDADATHKTAGASAAPPEDEAPEPGRTPADKAPDPARQAAAASASAGLGVVVDADGDAQADTHRARPNVGEKGAP